MPENLNAPAGTSDGAGSTQLAANRARKRRGHWRGLVCCALLALACWVAALTLPMSSDQHDFFGGVAAGAGVMTLAFAVVLVMGSAWAVASRPIREIPAAADLGDVPEVPADV